MPATKAIVVSEPSIIAHSEHLLIEAARLGNKVISKSDRARALAAEARATELQTKLTILENYVKTTLPPSPTPAPAN